MRGRVGRMARGDGQGLGGGVFALPPRAEPGRAADLPRGLHSLRRRGGAGAAGGGLRLAPGPRLGLRQSCLCLPRVRAGPRRRISYDRNDNASGASDPMKDSGFGIRDRGRRTSRLQHLRRIRPANPGCRRRN
jgi:hypothetical protein